MSKVVKLRRVLTAKQAEILIQKIATETPNKIIYSNHATARMEERGITIRDTLSVLRKGDVFKIPTVGKNEGEWKCEISRHVRGSNREIGVVTLIIKEERLFVVTVQWIDL